MPVAEQQYGAGISQPQHQDQDQEQAQAPYAPSPMRARGVRSAATGAGCCTPSKASIGSQVSKCFGNLVFCVLEEVRCSASRLVCCCDTL